MYRILQYKEMLDFLQLTLETMDLYMTLFGLGDRNMQVLEQELGVRSSLHGQKLSFIGDERDAQLAEAVTDRLLMLIRRGETVDPMRIRYAVSLAREGQLGVLEDMLSDVVAITHRGKQIRCKTLGQREYVRAVRANALTFALGPAGTGKTYLAMALAVVALRNKEIERIVLTRPAVEAGEKLGFLPGDMSQKVDPYLRPLYDALHEMMGADAYLRLQERGIVEVAPLAFMRGRTLSDSFIVLDEAQNTTSEQMKMFLTRLGTGSRCVVAGDGTQTDLPYGRASGLREAMRILSGVPGIGMVTLTARDVVRHELVQEIVTAYERYENEQRAPSERKS